MWLYRDKQFNPKKNPRNYGFIYKITYVDENGELFTYYGKKNFWSIKTLEAKKNGSKRVGHTRFLNKNKKGKRVKLEETKTPSNWRNYNGSCSSVPKNLKLCRKDIIKFCNSAIDLTFAECETLIKNNVLFDAKNLNSNILGKFYAGRIKGSVIKEQR